MISTYLILAALDIATIGWLGYAYFNFWDVITGNRNDYYWKKRTNFNNAVLAFVVVTVINAVVLL